ncbi:MAG: S26 family signal peptidase [Planctomycetota bacterium]|nr:S26 family signal peptidase [Planctomycetota bacterium]
MAHQNRPIVYASALVIVIVGFVIGWQLRNSGAPDFYQAPVVSGSMGQSIPGPHYALQCYDCNIPLIVDAETVGDEHLPVCFNCGAPNSLEDISAQINLVSYEDVDEAAFTRWQRVVFDYHDSRYIKRIVGLPGEKIAIENGELFVDGELYQKDLQEFDQLSSVVFDSSFQPHDSSYDLLQRFGVRGDEQGWIYTSDNVFAFDAPVKTHPQWLDYHHWNVVAGFVPPLERGTSTAIFDYLPYNQFISRSQLNFVDDFVLDISLRIYEPGVVGLRLLNVELELDFKRFELRRQVETGPVKVRLAKTKWDEKGTEVKFRVGLVDGRLIVANNNVYDESGFKRLKLSGDYDVDLAARLNPISISADEGILDITHLRIARDIYWLGADYTANRWETELTEVQPVFLLIGDNQPVSRDCRQWGEAIQKDAIVGVVSD